jgi:hypothetical protein
MYFSRRRQKTSIVVIADHRMLRLKLAATGFPLLAARPIEAYSCR